MDVSKASKIMSVNIDVPVTTAYNQWTRFVPKLMEGVDSVRQIDDSTLRWKSAIAGVTKEWTARITEQTPDKRIAWTNIDGATNAGVVTFHRLSDSMCRVALQLNYEPEGLVENAADVPGVASRRAKGDRDRFEEFIERRGRESGAFRGTIPSQHVRR
jgi:uncharacterized membrane protein